MAKLSIRDLDLRGKRVFIRVDFNVPLASGGQEITSDKRIRASLPTIQYALEQGAGVDPRIPSRTSKRQTESGDEHETRCTRLQELLGKPVKMAPDCVGPESKPCCRNPEKCCCSKIFDFIRKRKRTILSFQSSLRRCAIFTSTMHSALRTARTPPLLA